MSHHPPYDYDPRSDPNRVAMKSRDYRKNMAAVVLSAADMATISHEHASHSRVCAALETLSRRLLELTTVMQSVHVENPSKDLDSLTAELTWQLENAKQLAQGLGTYPDVYRALSAARIRAQCLHVCRSTGDSLENLSMVLMSARGASEFPDGYFDSLRDLAFRFRHLEYPLQSQDIMIRQKTKEWATLVNGGQLKQLDGLVAIRDYLEDVIGRDKMKEEWGKVSTFFLHDIYNAHARDDPEEEHYLRLLFWALNGVYAPPPEYLCPISLAIMQDPVVLLESEVTYERQNITTWMMEDETKTCPVSQKKIKNVAFIENASLKVAIINWQREQSRNPEADYGSVCHESEDLESVHCLSEMTAGVDDGWDGGVSTFSMSERINPLHAVPMGMRDFTDRASGIARHRRPSSDGMSLGSGSGSASRLQRRIMTKEIASQLFAAASLGSLDILREISEKGYDLAMMDDSGRNSLHLACIHGRRDVARYLLDQGLTPNVPTKDDIASPLILAATNGHARCVEVLLDRGADLIAQDKRGWTALHAACDHGHRSVIQSLVKFGEVRYYRYLDIKTEIGWTVLHNAARKGDLDVFKFLLQFRCNINEPCKAGWTVLHIAVERGHRAIVEEILKCPSVNVNAASRDGWTALHNAVESDDIDIGLLLVSKNINVNAASKVVLSQGGAHGTFFNKLRFGKMLVEEGKADLSLKTQHGRTARDITAEKGFNEFHQYLFRRGISRFFKPGKK